ncbi:MAG: 4Fe-4S dicluster domain-containing protein, partial [Chitinispirillia bacterium]
YEYIPDSSVETVIINVLDRDPICTVNHQLFRENTKLLPDCIELIKKVSGCSRIVFAITKQLSNIAKRSVGNYVEIAVIDPIYPNGFHEILVNRIFPNEKNSIKNSVIDLEYLLSMLIAVNSGKPYQDKVITLYAPDQSIEKNIQVKIGTPISEIFKEFNIELEDEFKVVINGAMSGVAWYNLNYPVTNFIHSIMVQNRQNVYKTENISCMNCGKCVAVCPVNLQVNLIGRYSEYRKFEECIRLDVGSCIECGLCAYSCTAHRPLVHYIRHAKVTINQKKEEII